MTKMKPDQELIKRIAITRGKSEQYIREQISKGRARHHTTREVELLVIAERFKIPVAAYQRTLSPDEREEARQILLQEKTLTWNNEEAQTPMQKVSITRRVNINRDFVGRDKVVQQGLLNGIFSRRSRRSTKNWYETWWGILILMVVGGLLVVLLTNSFGLTKP